MSSQKEKRHFDNLSPEDSRWNYCSYVLLTKCTARIIAV